MLFRAPSAARMPPLEVLLADQMAPARHIARHLGVSLRSLQRWRAGGNALRAAYLALWFESRWGMSALLCRRADRQNPSPLAEHAFAEAGPANDLPLR